MSSTVASLRSLIPISKRSIMSNLSEENRYKLIDGKAIASKIQQELKEEIKCLQREKQITPGVAVVLVGERPDSQTYVRMKKAAAEEVGVNFFLKSAPSTITQEELLKTVEDLNRDERVHGIIVQLPLPEHIHEEKILDAISLEKDVDGFHPSNIGRLAMRGRQPLCYPCTPLGCLELLERSGVNLEGKKVVVIGRSNIVGIPFSLICLHRNATVTVCHSKTNDLPEETRRADILIAAAGKPGLVRRDWVKKGAVVIDVGTNAVEDSTRKTGYRLVGDVAFEEVIDIVSKITPVPGGVGPMTVTMLLKNTVQCAWRFSEKTESAPQ